MPKLLPKRRTRRSQPRKRKTSFPSSTLEAMSFCQMPTLKTQLLFTSRLPSLLLTSRSLGKKLNRLSVKISLVSRSFTLVLIHRKVILPSLHTDLMALNWKN
jgi:hypothetical protein